MRLCLEVLEEEKVDLRRTAADNEEVNYGLHEEEEQEGRGKLVL